MTTYAEKESVDDGYVTWCPRCGVVHNADELRWVHDLSGSDTLRIWQLFGGEVDYLCRSCWGVVWTLAVVPRWVTEEAWGLPQARIDRSKASQFTPNDRKPVTRRIGNSSGGIRRGPRMHPPARRPS